MSWTRSFKKEELRRIGKQSRPLGGSESQEIHGRQHGTSNHSTEYSSLRSSALQAKRSSQETPPAAVQPVNISNIDV